jgi:WD40 repeat protein
LGVESSPDNSRFGSCGGDKSVFLWDVTSGAVIKRFSGHSSRVNAVEFNDDASVLASGAFLSSLSILNIADAVCLALSGSYDSTVSLWDLKFIPSSTNPSTRFSIEAHPFLSLLCFSPLFLPFLPVRANKDPNPVHPSKPSVKPKMP